MKVITPLAVAAAFALGACQPTPPAATTSAPVSQVAAPAASSGIASLLNTQRAAQGRGAISEDPRLSAAAQAHAQDMAANGYFSHTGLNGSRFTQRAQAAGYGCAVAENIASGQRSEAEVVNVWMNSSGHRRNILLGRASEFGIGRSGTVWVLMMGSGC